ncbi:MAG: FAD-dependent oxidoreductase [Pseudohongiella sp.]|nr:FAD-dependent oxidoreductase [Pseudohongiella sp.]
MIHKTSVQVVIVGGGIAGLWLLDRLSNQGMDVVLLEKNGLGNKQTLSSQGIIHGGLKYALNGVLSPASSAIAGMPERWRACLDGRGEVDLRGTRILSEHYYMWSTGSMRSRLKTFLGSKALRGRIDALPPAEYPAFFSEAMSRDKVKPGGTVYKLSDFVVDTPSLLQTLASRWYQNIRHCDHVQLEQSSQDAGHQNTLLRIQSGTQEIVVDAAHIILCAGEGNEDLLAHWQAPAGIKKPAMQRRPLHMVSVRVKHAAPAYLHCIGDSFGMTPRLTITSHPCLDSRDGEWIWYLGGDIAESGVHRDAQSQQTMAHKELSALFPWVDFSDASWHSFFINRAEPHVADLQRPDNAYVEECGNVIVCWPTKLTLSPNLGDRVSAILAARDRTDTSGNTAGSHLATLLAPANLSTPPWEAIR